jgi:putative tricarboxylic transport membrane protein
MYSLTEALSQVLTVTNLILIFGGVVWGLIFGIIPGLTATLAVVVLVPITYGLSPIAGISMLIGVYIGGISGGLVTAILVGMPGTPSSITTAFDGFPLTKQGLGGKALGTGIISNLVGSLFGLLFLITLAPQIAKFALRFGAFEYVAVILFGLTAVVSLSGKSLFKGLIMAIFGLLLSTIGMDPTYGMARNTFGLNFLNNGIGAIPAMIGLFVISQIFKEIENLSQKYIIPKCKTGNSFLSFKEFKQSITNFIRSGLIGVFIGILPGIGGALANFVAYDQAKKASKDPDSFGKGNIQGIIASETANNAVIAGALIPMLSLGIPGDAVTAALLGGLQLHSISPGPLLMVEHADLVYGVFASFFIASIFMFLVMLAGVKIFPTVLRVGKSILLPLVLVAGIVGCYNLQYSLQDVWVAVIFGFIGYMLLKKDYPLTPVVISLLLGKTFENQLSIALIQNNGSLLPLISRPFSVIFIIMALISVMIPLKKSWDSKKSLKVKSA